MIAIRKISLFIIVFILSSIIISCSNERIHEKIIFHLEQSYEFETEFSEVQDHLLQLETRDLQLYDEMMQLDPNEDEKLDDLVEEALQLIAERENTISDEKAIIDRSFEEFIKIEKYIAEISEEEMKQIVEQMVKAMKTRYDLYDEVYDEYVATLMLTKGLYETLIETNREQALYNQIEKTNEGYEQLFIANENFNDATNEYNTLKQSYFNKIRQK